MMSHAPRDPWPKPVDKRRRTRRNILVAAHEIFATTSVERTKIDDIAATAGVSVGTIYSHFGSKEGLAVAYLDVIFDQLDADLAALSSEPSPVARVLAAGDRYVQHVIDYPAASRMASVRAAYPASEHQDDAARALDRRMVTTLMGVASDLKLAMEAEEIRNQPIEELMLFVWGAWHGIATMVAREDHLTIPPELAKRALIRGRRLLLIGFGLDASGNRTEGAPAPAAVDRALPRREPCPPMDRSGE